MPIPEPKYKNSAGYLHAILMSLKGGDTYVTNIPALFSDIFPKDSNPNRTTMEGLAEIQKLYKLFREDMSSSALTENQQKVLLTGMGEIEGLIYPTQLNASFQPLGGAQAALLEMAAASLPEEDVPRPDEIEAIRESVRSLRELVESADISPALRRVLLDLIRMTEDALSRFKIYGARALKRAYKRMLSEALEAYADATASGHQDDLKKNAVWDKIVKHLNMIDSIASRLLKYRPVFAAAAQWLLAEPHQPQK